MKNNILNNREYGLSINSLMNGEFRSLIRFNLIAYNKKGGILVHGSKNKSEIYNNIIKLNQKIGIRVE